MSCSGGQEYAYNNALVEAIGHVFQEKQIRFRTTRGPEQEMDLRERTRGTQGQRLFVSIHHDSAQEIYITYPKGFPCSDHAAGYAIFVSQKNPYYEESLRFARLFGANLRAWGLRPSRHHADKIPGEHRQALDAELGIYRFDDLVVLKSAQCPAILFEAAVIINPKDDALARSEPYKVIIALSLRNAVQRFAKAGRLRP